MSRGRRRDRDPNASSQVTVHLSPEFCLLLDNYMVGLGLENRSTAIMMLAMAGASSLPLDAALGYALKQAMNSVKKSEFEALANHFLQRAALLDEATR